MNLRGFFNFILRRKSSKTIARERLRHVLIQDRAEASPHLLELLREELHGVISRYMVVDSQSSRVFLDQGEGAALLKATFTVKSFKRGRDEAS